MHYMFSLSFGGANIDSRCMCIIDFDKIQCSWVIDFNFKLKFVGFDFYIWFYFKFIVQSIFSGIYSNINHLYLNIYSKLILQST
jgi:hypothetical protein